MAAAKAWRAVRYVEARTLMAGTVKRVASNSPRPRARYSSWMLADGQPSAWLADQITQRQASRRPSSALKTASNDELVHELAAQRGRVGHVQAIPVDARRLAQAGEQGVGGLDGHRAMLAEGRDEGE